MLRIGKIVGVLFLCLVVLSELSYLVYLKYKDDNLKPVKIDLSARSAVIIDVGTGRVLYSKNPKDRLQPASTVKVMTAILALERAFPEGRITATNTVKKVEPTVAGLKPGVSYEVKDLVSAILIKSANDAAVTIAEGVAGKEANFSVMMNEKAREIGMTDTNFMKASGLPVVPREVQYTTAMDLAAMMRYALRHGAITETMAQKEAYITGSDNVRLRLKTHNKMLYDKESSVIGKTGYTKTARRTFVGATPADKPRIVFAILKSDDLWNDIRKIEKTGLELYARERITRWDDFRLWIHGKIMYLYGELGRGFGKGK